MAGKSGTIRGLPAVTPDVAKGVWQSLEKAEPRDPASARRCNRPATPPSTALTSRVIVFEKFAESIWRHWLATAKDAHGLKTIQPLPVGKPVFEGRAAAAQSSASQAAAGTHSMSRNPKLARAHRRDARALAKHRAHMSRSDRGGAVLRALLRVPAGAPTWRRPADRVHPQWRHVSGALLDTTDSGRPGRRTTLSRSPPYPPSRSTISTPPCRGWDTRSGDASPWPV